MRSLLRLGFCALAAYGMVFAARWLPDAITELDFFQARKFEVVGLHVLEEDYVLQVASIPQFASVFEDPGPWEERLKKHPLIRGVVINRVLPGTLVVKVEERTPVGFVASSVLEPVDRDGHVLPLDPRAYRLDLPLLRAAGTVERGLSPSELKVLATEVERLLAADPSFVAGVSEMSIDVEGDVMATISGNVLLRFRAPLPYRRLREGLAALQDAGRRRPAQRITVVDLRYADQVVVSYEGQRGQP